MHKGESLISETKDVCLANVCSEVSNTILPGGHLLIPRAEEAGVECHVGDRESRYICARAKATAYDVLS